MSEKMLLGPSCQSCGLPMMHPSDFGTEKSGVKKLDYCKFCYNDGALTEPEITLEEMVDKLAGPMAEKRGMPIEAAKEQTRTVMLMLKRWRVRDAK